MKASRNIEDMGEYLKSHYEYREGKIYIIKNHHKSRVGTELKGSLVGGYIQVCIKGKTLKMHRLVFYICHGYLPDVVDHINRVKNDNRIENLRAACNSTNIANSRKQTTKKCTSEYKGLYFRKNGYEVSITKDGQAYYLGRFKNETDAAKAYDKKAIELYGNFASTNF